MPFEQKDMFKAQEETGPAKLLFSITIPGRLPSWNDLLGMEHWGRMKLKESIQAAFLSSLRASARDSSMRTTWPKSTLWTACATLESYLAMRRERRLSESGKKKRIPVRRKKSESKFSKPEGPVPF